MTEAEWLTATEPIAMLELVRDGVRDRKLRLFTCACCRAMWDDKWPHRCRRVVEVAERFADGIVNDLELNHTRSLASQSAQNAKTYATRRRYTHGSWTYECRLFFAVDSALPEILEILDRYNVFKDDEQMRRVSPPLLRCIFGNPFRPIPFDPSWRTEAVTALAEGVYADRAFDRLPILADALQEAGCDNDDVLSHCRGDGPHARGCWVIDQLLGKA